MSNVDLIEVISKAKKGNQKAREALYNHYSADLYRYLYFLSGSKERSEDILQEAYIKAFLSLNTLKQELRFKTWLHRIARNIYYDLLKSAEESKREERDPEDMEAPEVSASVMDLRRILVRMRPEDRDLLLLVEMEGYAYSEVAEITGVSEGALRSRLHRIKKLFLEKKDETKGPAGSSK